MLVKRNANVEQPAVAAKKVQDQLIKELELKTMELADIQNAMQRLKNLRSLRHVPV